MNSEFKRRAQQSLSGQWSIACGAMLIYIVLNSVVTLIIGLLFRNFEGEASVVLTLLQSAFTLVINSVATAGLFGIFLNISRQRGVSIDDFFANAHRFPTVLLISIITSILISVGTLLCVLPGIYIALRLNFAVEICLDNPDMGALDCIRYSFDITEGHVLDILSLLFSYLGWYLLCLVFCGIPALVVVPYVNVGRGMLYLELLKEY